MKYRVLFISTLAGLIVFLTVYAKSDTDNTKQMDRFPTVMRRIGHQLLLSAGDSQSRVLPVKQLADMSYRIQFENQLSLEPGSLIRIISDNTKSYSLPDDYTVNVLDCSDQQKKRPIFIWFFTQFMLCFRPIALTLILLSI